jgi:hypothetical protein
MNGQPPELSRRYALAVKLAMITALVSVSAASIAGPTIPGPKWQPDEEEEVVYVDSVTKWGAWELDIEPAAGGVELASPRAMGPRDSKVALRTNSIAELGPPTNSTTSPTPVPPTPTPMPPVVPVTPPTPPVTPPVPPRIGGPTDGLF